MYIFLSFTEGRLFREESQCPLHIQGDGTGDRNSEFLVHHPESIWPGYAAKWKPHVQVLARQKKISGFQNCFSLRCSLSREPLNSPLPSLFHTALSHSCLFKFFTITHAHSHSLLVSSCQTTFKLSEFLLRPGVNQHSSTTANISTIIYAHWAPAS